MNTTNILNDTKIQSQHDSPNLKNILIGVIGMLIAVTGNLLPPTDLQKWCYLIGGLFLLISSSLERQQFFIALQIIILGGAAVAFAPWSPMVKACLPIALSILAIVYFAKKKLLTDKLTAFGCVGITILAAGYAISNPIIYLAGSLVLMVYSFLSFRRGVKIALIWAILNALFAMTASIAVMNYL